MHLLVQAKYKSKEAIYKPRIIYISSYSASASNFKYSNLLIMSMWHIKSYLYLSLFEVGSLAFGYLFAFIKGASDFQ